MTCIRLTKDLLIIESGECCNTGLHNICPARAFLVARESFRNCRNSKLCAKASVIIIVVTELFPDFCTMK